MLLVAVYKFNIIQLQSPQSTSANAQAPEKSEYVLTTLNLGYGTQCAEFAPTIHSVRALKYQASEHPGKGCGSQDVLLIALAVI